LKIHNNKNGVKKLQKVLDLLVESESADSEESDIEDENAPWWAIPETSDRENESDERNEYILEPVND
jgi:hypothetical protein